MHDSTNGPRPMGATGKADINAFDRVGLATGDPSAECAPGRARDFQKHHGMAQMFNTRAHRGRDWAVITNAAGRRPIRMPAIMSEA